MYSIIVITFLLGYAAIAFEHLIKVNKTASALFTGVLCWTIYILGRADTNRVSEQLYEHFGQISGILFFLLGAMTIVELIDAHDGFEVITRRIKTTDKRKLLWITSFIAFFLSAIIDNLTTAIVMISLLRKLVTDKETRMFYIGFVIIAANAGGAWSPIGDVTTTMLWIGGQITSLNIMAQLILPSLICIIVPLIFVSYRIMGKIEDRETIQHLPPDKSTNSSRRLILGMGLGVLVFVPIFKAITDLPPFVGILFGLAVLWILTELINKDKDEEEKDAYSVVQALRKADVPSVLFFLGILMAIAALDSAHLLADLAVYLDKTIGSWQIIVITIGLLSAVIDNVPLVAAVMGMYDLQTFPTDHHFWTFVSYCAGTGGSCLIIGSAAGVAAMGLEKIDYFWYLKKISGFALLGYLAGALSFLAQRYLFSLL